ncbi:MAG TPA: DUF4124 domain-containing protein [Pelomicrobium sp.]|nr:DUF4124 domain-containing protein [Pelomicrobium sp.]
MRHAILAVILACLTLPAGAELYKWVDSQGKVHYSDRPPPNAAQKSTTMKGAVSAPAPAATASPAPQKTIKEQELEYRQRKAEEAEAAAKAQKEADMRAQNCRNARGNLNTYTEGGRVVRFNAQGEREYVGDEERVREIERWQREVERWCSPGRS